MRPRTSPGVPSVVVPEDSKMDENRERTNDGDDSSRSLVDRREYLKLTGASAAAFAGGFAATGTATAAPTNTGSVSGSGYSTTDHGDYIEVTVGQGGQWTCSLDSGDVLSNYLIDISASNANAQISPTGSGWTVENVGFKGVSDDAGTMPNKHITPLVTSGGTGTIRHLYMGDGAVSDRRKGAIWVNPDHAGELLIQEVYLAGWADNGLYGSAPGNGSDHVQPGNGGTVKVSDSYSGFNRISNFRLGTTGSYLDNCVMEGGPHRSFWCYYEDTEIRNCDITGAYIDVGEDLYRKGRTATVTATNCRYDVNVDLSTSGNEFYGSSQGSPDMTLPTGVPTSALEAATGESSGGGGGGGGTTVPDSGTLTVNGGSNLSSYRFGAGGSITANSDADIGDGDTVYANNTVSGTAKGGTDTYDYTGGTTFCNVYGDATIEIDGTAFGPADLGQLPNTLSVDSTDSNNLTDYDFTVSGQIEKSAHNSASIDSEDTIADGTANGSVQGGADSYRFSGSVSEFNHTGGSIRLYVNGQEKDPATFPGESSGAVVDDFEDGDLSEYSFDRGSTGASIVSSPTHGGSYALEYAGSYTEAISTSGLGAYPAAGDTFDCWVRTSGGANNLNFTWGVQDHQNRYYVKLYPADGKMFLFTYKSGTATSQGGNTGLSLSQDAWYRLEVQWATDGTQTVTLYDTGGTQLSQLSMTDSTWTSGGVGYDAYLSSGQSIYFDDVTIQ